MIEWNAHLFDSDTVTFPFHSKAAYTPNPTPVSRASPGQRAVAPGAAQTAVQHGTEAGLQSLPPRACNTTAPAANLRPPPPTAGPALYIPQTTGSAVSLTPRR